MNPKKAIPFLKECKEFFTQDGRDLEMLWSTVWLAAAYGQAGERENARSEISGISFNRTQSRSCLLAVIRQASPWLKSLQSDPLIGRQLNTFL